MTWDMLVVEYGFIVVGHKRGRLNFLLLPNTIFTLLIKQSCKNFKQHFLTEDTCLATLESF